jgi:hypothetical protein
VMFLVWLVVVVVVIIIIIIIRRIIVAARSGAWVLAAWTQGTWFQMPLNGWMPSSSFSVALTYGGRDLASLWFPFQEVLPYVEQIRNFRSNSGLQQFTRPNS